MVGKVSSGAGEGGAVSATEHAVQRVRRQLLIQELRDEAAQAREHDFSQLAHLLERAAMELEDAQ